MVPMVLNSHGIEPNFLKLDSWFYSYYNLQCIELDKEKNAILINDQSHVGFTSTPTDSMEKKYQIVYFSYLLN